MQVVRLLRQKIAFLVIILLAVFSCVKDNGCDDRNLGRKVPPSEDGFYNPKEYAPYSDPYSRGYFNPYSHPPRKYAPYYDYDQYYVPPSEYNDNEEGNSSAVDFKS